MHRLIIRRCAVVGGQRPSSSSSSVVSSSSSGSIASSRIFRGASWRRTVENVFRHTYCTAPTWQTEWKRGVAESDKGNAAAAVQILTKVAQQQSSNAEVQFSLGVAYHQAGNLDKAAEQFKKAAMIDSDNWKYFFNAGIVESELGKFKRAIAAYEDALQIDPTNSKIHNNIGVIKQQQGDSEGAIAHFRKAIELNPQFDRAFNNLGNALLESGELEQAIESFTTALSHDANNVEYHNNLGIALRDDNRLQDAIKHFNIAISKSEDNPVHEIWDNLATTYQRSQQLPEAIEAYKHAIAASKKAKQPRKDLYGYLMSAMQDARREADVKAVIDDAIRTFPNDAEILSIIASFKRDYGDQNQFRAYAKLAVDANPQDWHGWAQMGLADADDENFAEAAAKFERAAALTKRKNPQVLVWLGTAQQMEKNLDAAERNFKAALKLDPSHIGAYESLAALHFQEKHYEESIEYFKTLIRLSPGHADAYMHLGIALQQLGTKYLGEAIRYLETAVQLLPEDDWAGRMNLGMALADAGKKTKAREVLAEAVRRNPELQSSVDDMIKHDVI